MPHTNQLIEETSEKIVRKFISEADDSMFPIELDKAIVEALSQTEQECDKKWGERIESFALTGYDEAMYSKVVVNCANGIINKMKSYLLNNK